MNHERRSLAVDIECIENDRYSCQMMLINTRRARVRRGVCRLHASLLYALVVGVRRAGGHALVVVEGRIAPPRRHHRGEHADYLLRRPGECRLRGVAGTLCRDAPLPNGSDRVPNHGIGRRAPRDRLCGVLVRAGLGLLRVSARTACAHRSDTRKTYEFEEVARIRNH